MIAATLLAWMRVYSNLPFIVTILKRRLQNVCMHVHVEFSEGFAFALRRIRDCNVWLGVACLKYFRFVLLFFDRLLSFDAF